MFLFRKVFQPIRWVDTVQQKYVAVLLHAAFSTVASAYQWDLTLLNLSRDRLMRNGA